MLLDVSGIMTVIDTVSAEELAEVVGQLASLLEMARMRSHIARMGQLLEMLPRQQQPRLITLRDAGGLLGVCEDTVRELIRAGELRVVHIRGAVRMDVADIQAFIEERKHANPNQRQVPNSEVQGPFGRKVSRRIS